MPISDRSRFWRAAEAALAAALVGLPGAFGGAPEWTLWLLLGLASVALGAWALGAARNHRRWGWHPVLIVPALVSLVALVQLVPLPPSLLAELSPRAAELREFALVPLGLERWRPLSMDAPATARGLSRCVSLGMLLFVALELGRLPGVRRRLFMVLAVSGAVTAAVGFGHLVAGLEALFGLTSFTCYAPLITPFGNGNHLAAWLTLSATIAVGLAMSAESRDAAVGWAAAALLSGVGVFFSLSRGGIAAFVFTWFLVGAAVVARRGGGLKTVLPWLLIGGTVLGGIFLSLEQFLERAESLSTLEKLKATKLDLWPMFAAGLSPYWKLGAGLGAFELALSHAPASDLTVTFTHPEMIALQWAADLGAPLAAVAALLALWVAVRLWLVVRERPLESAALLGLLGLVVHDVFDFALELNAVSAAAVITLGLLCALDPVEHRDAVRRRGLLLAGAPVAAALIAAAWGLPGHLAAEGLLAEPLRAGASFAEVRTRALVLIDRHPADWVLYSNVARYAATKADPRESLAWINRVLFLRPPDAGSHVAAAQALLRLGRPLQALAELKLAWEHGDSSSLELGLTIATKEQAWDRVLLERRGHLERAYWTLRARQRNDDALALVRAGRFAPPSEEVRVEASVLLVRHEAELGDAARALDAIGEFEESLRADGQVVFARVHALNKLGRPAEAAKALEALLKREPANVAAGFMLADQLGSLGRHAAAREVLLRVRPFSASPAQRAASFEREASAWLQEERHARALDALQTAARIEPMRADLHYRLADVLERMGSLHSALDEVRRGRLLDSREGARARDAQVARLEAAMNTGP